MTDGHVLPDGRGQALVGVDHGVVLHAGPGPDHDAVEVSSQDGSEPHARPRLDHHVPDERRGWSHVGIFGDAGFFPFKREYVSQLPYPLGRKTGKNPTAT